MRPVSFERWQARSPYEVLGVHPGASAADLKRAWRAAAKANHPDRRGGDATAMAEINAAFEVLEHHRADLDAFLGQSARRGRSSPPATLPWCVRCGATDATLRVAAYPTVTAFGGLRVEVHPEVLCAACRDRAAGQAALTSALSGWWARGGPTATVRAIGRIWRDDAYGPPEVDAALLRAGAAACLRRGRREEARRLMTASLALREDAGARALLSGWGGPLASPVPWSARLGGAVLRFGGAFAPLAVLELLLLGAWGTWPDRSASDPAPSAAVEVEAPAPDPPPTPPAPRVAVDPTDPAMAGRVQELHALERRGHELQAQLAAADATLAALDAELTQAASRAAGLAVGGIDASERALADELSARMDALALAQAAALAERDRAAAALVESRAAYSRAFDELSN